MITRVLFVHGGYQLMTPLRAARPKEQEGYQRSNRPPRLSFDDADGRIAAASPTTGQRYTATASLQ